MTARTEPMGNQWDNDAASGENDGKSDAYTSRMADGCSADDARRPGRPPRPIPADFEERFPQIGWTEAESEWGAHARSIAAWIDALGADRMKAKRREYLRASREVQSRVRRKSYR